MEKTSLGLCSSEITADEHFTATVDHDVATEQFGYVIMFNEKNLLLLPRRLCFRWTLFVCLSVCEQDNSKSYGRIFLKF